MPQIVLKLPNRPPEFFPLERLRTTIGRSARSDICIADAFASRLHAEIRQEGDRYWIQDLGSANGTIYNGVPITLPVPLAPGGEIRIGETILMFQDTGVIKSTGSTMIEQSTDALDPSKTISFSNTAISTGEIISREIFSSQNDLLGLISKVGVALLSTADLEETLNQVADLVFEAVPAQRVVIMLRDKASEGGLRVAVARERGKAEDPKHIRISRKVMTEVLEHGKSVLTSDAQHDPKFASQTMALLDIRSVIAVPLGVTDKETLGLLYADSPTFEKSLEEDHLKLLTTLASVASLRLEKAALVEERIIRDRLEQELKLATEIQQRFQPLAPPKVDGYEFQGISFSCYEIGGDYYDFIQREKDKTIIALGDVSGKGTAAALLMSSLHAAIHAQVSAGSTIDETVESVNFYLSANTPSNRFVTLFFGELQESTGKLQYINAGHNPPLLIRASGEVEELESSGLPLGIVPVAEYQVWDTTLNRGDALIIYSDGVSEAVNDKGEEFGVVRLTEVVKKGHKNSAAGIRDAIESGLSQFTRNTPANDDITLVIVKRQN